MNNFNWEDSYQLHIPKIDEQHKHFFEIWESVCNNTGNHSNDELNEIIVKLEDYLKMHFAYEEELMEKADTEEYGKHLRQHIFFIDKIDELKLENSYMNPFLFEKITLFMKKWFLTHILQADTEYQESVLKYLKLNKL